MQGLKVLLTIADEIARVNEITDGQMHTQKPNAYVAPCQQVQRKTMNKKKISLTAVSLYMYL